MLGKGLYAPYVPPEQAEDSAIQDPHRVVRCAAAPDVMWMQHHAGIIVQPMPARIGRASRRPATISALQ